MNRDEMVDALQQLGFQRQSTVSGKWRGAFFKSNGEKSMLVLVRTRGVDVLVSTLTREEMTTPDGMLRVSSQRPGDNFGEYYYTDSTVNIHQRALKVAELFVSQEPINDEYFDTIGIGRREWGRTYGNNSIPRPRNSSSGGGSELYDAICGEPGESAYLGDGVWVNSDGSMEDRGR